jgi:hypothetical protein
MRFFLLATSSEIKVDKKEGADQPYPVVNSRLPLLAVIKFSNAA